MDQDFVSIPDLIRTHAAHMPAHPALVLEDRSVGYAELDAMMDRVAASLQRDGVKPGEVIAICAATSIEYAAAFLGSVRAGVVVAPLAPDSTPAGLAAMVADAGAKFLFLDDNVARVLTPVIAQITARRIALDDSASTTGFSAWQAPAGAVPREVAIRPDWAFNII